MVKNGKPKKTEVIMSNKKKTWIDNLLIILLVFLMSLISMIAGVILMSIFG